MSIPNGKKAFTLIELIFVIVILGLSSVMGARVIANAYSSYIKTMNINSLNADVELAVEQISKRLSSRVRGSTIGRKSDGTFLPLSTIVNTSDYKIVEWIGSFYEGQLGNFNEGDASYAVPQWSGFIDINSSKTSRALNTIHTPMSSLSYMEKTIEKLFGYHFTVLNLNNDYMLGLIFKGSNKNYLTSWGWDASNHKDVHLVKVNSADVFDVKDVSKMEYISERYDLAWSAYALSVEGGANDFNLTLYYDYRPWLGERYTDGKKTILAKHVSTFRIYQGSGTIRLKICLNDNKKADAGKTIGFCKEKVIP